MFAHKPTQIENIEFATKNKQKTDVRLVRSLFQQKSKKNQEIIVQSVKLFDGTVDAY